MNKWNIPDLLEEKVRKRDLFCVYCRVKLKYHPKRGEYKIKATWEHIDNDIKNISEFNIVRCCNSCNASKGVKNLVDWFNSSYCDKKDINKKTVADIIKKNLNFIIK